MKDILLELGLTKSVITIILSLCGVIGFLVFKVIVPGIKKELERLNTQQLKKIEDMGKDIKDIKEDVEELKQDSKENGKATRIEMYDRCMDLALHYQDRGYLTPAEKVAFEMRWKKYETLGDGMGDEPKKIVDNISVKNN